MTADTVAAILTILGYSIYDTIIVFDRDPREHAADAAGEHRQTVANVSVSEVLKRSIVTSTITLLPIVALFHPRWLDAADFAFAIMVGIAVGAVSTIFIATPILTQWKERERVYKNRQATHPARARGRAGVRNERRGGARGRRARRAARSPAGAGSDSCGENISKAEFDELVRDLDIDSPAPARDPAADLEPEEVVMPGQPAGQPDVAAKQRRARNRRHGR